MDTPMPIGSSSVYPASAGVRYSMLKWMVIALPFAWLWFHLIQNLRLQWTTDPQYSYGLVMPLLTAGLLIRRWHRYSSIPLQPGEFKNPAFLVALVAFSVFLYLPTRLLEEAVPEWRPIGWVLAVQTIGLTLYGLYLFKGWSGVIRFAFPICFFFTAVPWPTVFEQPIIQHLSRINATIVVNVLGILGVPAVQQGNIIQISTGLVGINDACSGIRSLQSSLMISLFLGEFYFMNWSRRLLLVLGGFTLAMFFNACRTSILTYLASQKGIAAIAQYHDETGMTILFACTATLWAVSYLVSLLPKRSPALAEAPQASIRQQTNGNRLHALRVLATSLIIWVVLSEIAINLWYAVRESKIPSGPQWSLALPEDNATFQTLPFTPEEHTLLRFDDGKQGKWEEPDGTLWQAFYFDWLPGRVAGYLAKRHTPDICLTAEGMALTSGPTLMMLNIHNLALPVRCYVFTSPNGPLQVFQCHWEPGIEKNSYANESSRFNLIRSIWAGRGDKGQKVIEIVISGCHDSDSAKEALARELQKLIQIQGSQT